MILNSFEPTTCYTVADRFGRSTSINTSNPQHATINSSNLQHASKGYYSHTDFTQLILESEDPPTHCAEKKQENYRFVDLDWTEVEPEVSL
jgi:hypothetical protein